MENKDYEQKKRECWDEFNNDVGRCKDRPKICFFRAFDSAYAFGRKKEAISQEDVEKAAEKYAKDAYYPAPDYNWYESDDEQMKEVLDDTFKAGANFALGKQEKEADTVISGWVARDIDGSLFVYDNPPKRIYDGVYSQWSGSGIESLPNNIFPDLTWDSDPEPVEIIIKRKKNGTTRKQRAL